MRGQAQRRLGIVRFIEPGVFSLYHIGTLEIDQVRRSVANTSNWYQFLFLAHK
jgi:hypothetical protein